MQFILNVLSTTAVSAILLSALAWLSKTWIVERLKTAVKLEYKREIESYKSMLALAHSASAVGQKAAIEARMEAFDRIWKTWLELKNATSGITFFYDICTPAEHENLWQMQGFVDIAKSLNDQKLLKMVTDSDVEEIRPYVGEVVWSLFWGYRAFCLRLVKLMQMSQTEREKANWQRDKSTRSLLGVILTPEELIALDAKNISKIDFIRRSFEEKFLTSSRRMISGEEYGKEALRQSNVILEAVSSRNFD